MEGNRYWEEQKRQYYAQASEDEIVSRIKECQFVVEKLEQDKLWQIVVRNAEASVTQLDANWQDMYDEKQLQQMRVLKLAATQVTKMKEGYVQEWKLAKEELDRKSNPDVIEKDYEK